MSIRHLRNESSEPGSLRPVLLHFRHEALETAGRALPVASCSREDGRVLSFISQGSIPLRQDSSKWGEKASSGQHSAPLTGPGWEKSGNRHVPLYRSVLPFSVYRAPRTLLTPPSEGGQFGFSNPLEIFSIMFSYSTWSSCVGKTVERRPSETWDQEVRGYLWTRKGAAGSEAGSGEPRQTEIGREPRKTQIFKRLS